MKSIKKPILRRVVGISLIATFMLGLAISCQQRRPVALISELVNSGDYFSELSKWYRKRRVYSDLDVRFYVEATYLGRPLLLAYVAEYSRAYTLTEDEQRELYKAQLGLYDNDHKDVFFVSLYAPYQDWDRLDNTDNVWKLRATYMPANVEIKPVLVEEISAEDPKINYFFPYTERWARHFRIVVDANVEATEVVFSMQGVVGNQEFRWNRQ